MNNSRNFRFNDGSRLCVASISRIVEMAWEERTAFKAIEAQFGLDESAVIALMRRHMKPSLFQIWRKRGTGRRTEHAVLRGAAFCATVPQALVCDRIFQPAWPRPNQHHMLRKYDRRPCNLRPKTERELLRTTPRLGPRPKLCI